VSAHASSVRSTLPKPATGISATAQDAGGAVGWQERIRPRQWMLNRAYGRRLALRNSPAPAYTAPSSRSTSGRSPRHRCRRCHPARRGHGRQRQHGGWRRRMEDLAASPSRQKAVKHLVGFRAMVAKGLRCFSGIRGGFVFVIADSPRLEVVIRWACCTTCRYLAQRTVPTPANAVQGHWCRATCLAGRCGA
jgi:hypothetical protein